MNDIEYKNFENTLKYVMKDNKRVADNFLLSISNNINEDSLYFIGAAACYAMLFPLPKEVLDISMALYQTLTDENITKSKLEKL